MTATSAAEPTMGRSHGTRPGPSPTPSCRTDPGMTVWLTGLSGAGKSTIADALMDILGEQGRPVEVLDGDVVRENLSKGLGFSKEDRDTNIRRIGFVADLLTRHGVIALVAAISPYRDVREEVQRKIGRCIEVYVRCPLEELARRDVKGLYLRAMRGEIPHFTGVSDPYEEPTSPDVVVDSSKESIEVSVAKVLAAMDAVAQPVFDAAESAA